MTDTTTSNLLGTIDGEHWHIDASSEGPECCADIYAALEQAHFWIDGETDAEHQSISVLGESGMFEEAFRAWEKCEALSALLLNIANITDHHYGRKQPAPLYAGEDGGDLLLAAAKRIADSVNESDAHVSIYEHAFVRGMCDEESDD